MHDHSASLPTEIERGLTLITRIGEIVVALTEIEFQVAAILDFDPEAALPAGTLAQADRTAPDSHFPCQLTGSQMEIATWRRLAHASTPEADRLDRASCLALFLARRAISQP
jgi:hypothetical protein